MTASRQRPARNTATPVVRWIEYRLPVFSSTNEFMGTDYPAPRNLNYWWNFGSLAGVALVLQILTGIVLAMHYTPHVDYAFESVERIMRDVNFGWLLRYAHANGASLFFIVVYIHLFRGLYYGSYKSPRELLWMLGVVILLLMMATAFMGYVLPWGQMSFWAATVITNLFSAIPLVRRGHRDLAVGRLLGRQPDARPLLLAALSAAVRDRRRRGPAPARAAPARLEQSARHRRKSPKDSLPFHPYYTIKDLFGLGVFMIVLALFVFYAPNLLGHPDNYIPANPLQTPPHIVPEWYFLPFYAILRAITFDVLFIPAKLLGVILMFGSILVLFFLPWLDTSPVRSSRFRPIYKWFFWVLVADCVLLGYLGAHPPEGSYVLLAQIGTAYYFFHFLILLPLLGRLERPRPLPRSISEPVLGLSPSAPAPPNEERPEWAMSRLSTARRRRAGPRRECHGGSAQIAEAPEPIEVDWQHDGVFGTFDRAAAQRGFQVYREVCSACHGLTFVAFRNLMELGFSEDQVRALAAEYTVTDGPDDDGEMFERPAAPADPIPPPYPNPQAARVANGGALPPELSLITKARADGTDYVYSLLVGYEEPPADIEPREGMYYNAFFPGHWIAMPPPLVRRRGRRTPTAPRRRSRRWPRTSPPFSPGRASRRWSSASRPGSRPCCS